MPAIVRRALRDQVHEQLLEMIYQGTLRPGSRVSDVTLSAELGVSRTPVREALIRLAREGVVASEVGRGFVVRPLSVEEVREAYPILWTMEILGLTLSPRPAAATLEALDRISLQMVQVRDEPEQLIDLDERWHGLLLSSCPNRRLLELIRGLKAGLRRYEFAYMRDAGRVGVSTEHHARITSALSAGDIDTAREWLRRNWEFGMHEVLAWLESDVTARGSANPPALGNELE